MANDINSLSNSTLIRPNKGETKAAENKSANNSTLKSTQDVLEVSDSAAQLQRLQSIVKDLPDVNLDKVAELKQAIKNGSYEINASAIADKLMTLQSDEK